MNTLYAANHWKIHGASTLSSITLSTSIGCLDFVDGDTEIVHIVYFKHQIRTGRWVLSYPYSLF